MALTKAKFRMIGDAPANVVDYGADPTGVSDSRAAILAALGDSNHIYFPKGTYISSATITVSSKDIQIDGNESTLTFTTGYLDISGTISSAYTITSNAVFTEREIVVSGGSFTTDDILQIVNTTDFSFSNHREYYRQGQMLTIREVSGNTITTHEQLDSGYSVGANIEITKITPVKVIMRDLHVFAPDDTASTYATSIAYAKDIYIENCTFDGGDAAGLHIKQSLDAIVKNSVCQCTAPTTSGLQYGISIDDASRITVDKCELYGSRHATGLGGSGKSGSKDLTIKNSRLSALPSSFAADIHGNCSNVLYENNEIYGGATIAGEYASYINNRIWGADRALSLPAINLTEIVGGNFVIDGNLIVASGNSTNSSMIRTTSSGFIADINYNYHLQITNNEFVVTSNQSSIVAFGTHDEAPTVQPSITWENNKFRNDCSNLTRIFQQTSFKSGATYVDLTGPIIIKDFTPHSTMSSSIKIYDVTQGTIGSGAVFYLPEIHIQDTLTIASGTSTKAQFVTLPYSYGSLIPPIQATISNIGASGAYYPFVGVGSITSSAFTALVTTGDTGNTLPADFQVTVNFHVGGAYTK